MAEISIQNNPLARLTGFAFAGLRNVTHLCLGYNRITKIDGLAYIRIQRFSVTVTLVTLTSRLQ